MVTDEMVENAERVYWDTSNDPEGERDMRAALEAALSAAEPVGYATEYGVGYLAKKSWSFNLSMTKEADDVNNVALYDRPPQPAPSVAVKALEWGEFSTELKRHFQSNTILGQYQIAYLGEFECWQLYSPQKSATWKENFSRHKSSEEAKAAAQADYEARIRSALSAQVQDVAGDADDYYGNDPAELKRLLAQRDKWLVNNDHWYNFTRSLPAAPAKQEGGESQPVHKHPVENGESGDK